MTVASAAQQMYHPWLWQRDSQLKFVARDWSTGSVVVLTALTSDDNSIDLRGFDSVDGENLIFRERHARQ